MPEIKGHLAGTRCLLGCARAMTEKNDGGGKNQLTFGASVRRSPLLPDGRNVRAGGSDGSFTNENDLNALLLSAESLLMVRSIEGGMAVMQEMILRNRKASNSRKRILAGGVAERTIRGAVENNR